MTDGAYKDLGETETRGDTRDVLLPHLGSTFDPQIKRNTMMLAHAAASSASVCIFWYCMTRYPNVSRTSSNRQNEAWVMLAAIASGSR